MPFLLFIDEKEYCIYFFIKLQEDFKNLAVKHSWLRVVKKSVLWKEKYCSAQNSVIRILFRGKLKLRFFLIWGKEDELLNLFCLIFFLINWQINYKIAYLIYYNLFYFFLKIINFFNLEKLIFIALIVSIFSFPQSISCEYS